MFTVPRNHCDRLWKQRRVHRAAPRREGCCTKTRLGSSFPDELHFSLQTWVDVSMANSCSSTEEKVPPVSRTFSTCVRACVYVCAPRLASPCAPLTGLNQGKGRRLCGPPSSSSQSKYLGKWRRCNKTWPGRGGEWMASVSCMINEKSGFQCVARENWEYGT